ncbi:type I restriction-modification system subunit M N-terminal domain-containing protein [Hominenteromicrobium sp.]|uniref:type I restriction-modification system subunit M N-terminal domain-containing protein n=1 Tax=Hominenteromicrobium sp. TaxID=3073581 RepID=UPI003A8FF28A
MAKVAKPKKEISMEEALWKSADKLRGSVEPAEYKHVVLSLFFLKFASDKFDDCRNRIIANHGERFADMKPFYTQENVFYLPEESRWSYIMANAKQDDIALKIDTALYTIEKNNPSLKGALPDNYYTVFEVIDEKELIPEYLMLWFSRPEFDRYARFKSHGSVREVMDWDEMCKVKLPVPSYEEQKQIVEGYKTITERISLKKQVNDNLVETLSAIYKELFSDAETRFPKMPLQKICSKIGSGATPKGGKTAYISEGISLIRSTNVFDFNFEYGDLAHINQSQADALANVIVEPNDVLFNITGVSVARCCMVPADVLPARVNQHVMIVRPIMGETMSYYIMFTLCAADNKAKLLGIGQSGSTREAINKQELESFEIPIPDETTLNQFSSSAKSLYEKIYANVKEIRVLDEMKKVLLAQLSSR